MENCSGAVAIIPENGVETIVTQCVKNFVGYTVKTYLVYPFKTVIIQDGADNGPMVCRANTEQEAEKNHIAMVEKLMNGEFK